MTSRVKDPGRTAWEEGSESCRGCRGSAEPSTEQQRLYRVYELKLAARDSPARPQEVAETTSNEIKWRSRGGRDL